MRLTRRAAMLLPLAATGCETLDNWFGDKKVPLPGQRISIGQTQRGMAVDNPAKRTVTLPPERVDTAWLQSGGSPAHVPGNLGFGARLEPVWSAHIGASSGYRRRITATPVVGGGRVFAMDSDAVVSAYDQRNGARLWLLETELPHTRSTNLGGGLALDGDTLYVGTGLASLLALDAASGKIRWRKPLDQPARSAPTVTADRLFQSTLDEQLVAFAKSDGSQLWLYKGTPTPTAVLGPPSPAFAGGLVVAGFGSGDLICLTGLSGSVSWADELASQGRDPMLDFSTVTGLPVISDGNVYAAGMGGVLVCLDLRTGRRLWERDVTAEQSPWLAGDWLFVLTTDQTLGAIHRADGTVPWASQLPLFKNEKTKEGPIQWLGPLLAGGRLILVGSSREALMVDPLNGTILSRQKLPTQPIVAPVVADRTMFVVGKDATLVALR